MNNKKFLEAIKALRAGLDLMEASVVEGMTETVKEVPVVEEKVEKKATKKETPAPTVEKAEVSEEEIFETIVTQEELIALELVGLKELAKEMGVEAKKNDSAKTLSSRIMKEPMGNIVEALGELGYYENDEDEDLVDEEADEKGNDEEAESEEEDLATQLAEYETEDLAEVLAEAGLSTKGKKQALIDRILKAIADGKIDEKDLFESDEDESEEVTEVEEVEAEEVNTEDIVDELDDDQLKELAEMLEIEMTVTKKVAGKTKKSFLSIDDIKKAVLAHDDLESALVELGYVEGDEETEEESDEEETEFEVSEERLKTEEKVDTDIRKAHKAKKLKDSDIKKFLEKYDEADSKDKLVTYIGLKQRFVDDGGVVNPESEPYMRDDKEHCCGVELAETDGVFVCEICGEEYAND